MNFLFDLRLVLTYTDLDFLYSSGYLAIRSHIKTIKKGKFLSKCELLGRSFKIYFLEHFRFQIAIFRHAFRKKWKSRAKLLFITFSFTFLYSFYNIWLTNFQMTPASFLVISQFKAACRNISIDYFSLIVEFNFINQVKKIFDFFFNFRRYKWDKSFEQIEREYFHTYT